MTRIGGAVAIGMLAGALGFTVGYYTALVGGAGIAERRPSAVIAKEPAGHEDGGIEMSDAKVAAAGIELASAAPGVLRETLRLNGLIQPNQETLIQVTPRFPGVVKEMRKRLGDKVAKGELLATVESNQSLTTYELRAPIAGTVIDRQGSLGEHVSEQKPVFIVADLSSVWIDFSIYRRDFSRIQVGDAVVIDPEDGGATMESKISYVSPLGTSDTQSGLARLVAPNDGRLRAGLFVTGRLLLTAKPVEVAIKLSALQTIDGKTIVFVRNGKEFESREVELGTRDAEHVEVTFGLVTGDLYAAKNSFVIKAELAKGGVSHDH